MIVHNITTKVSWQAVDTWLRWQQEVFFVKIQATGLCKECRLFHLQDQDETEGPTYTAQLIFGNQEHYSEFLSNYFPAITKEQQTLWSALTVDFSTTMRLVN